jgi:hypothetical protein
MAAPRPALSDGQRIGFNKQYNPAFVLMQYLGYLRRNPNDAPTQTTAGSTSG